MADEPLRIAHAPEPRTGFADCEYDIFLGDRRVGRYGHDYRGGEHWIRLGDGPREECALGAVWQFTEDEGALPLRLGQPALEFLRRRLAAEGG
jgi:hypothetical protein